MEVQCERRILGEQSKSGWNPFPTHWNDVQGVGGCVLKHILQLLIGNHVLSVCTPLLEAGGGNRLLALCRYCMCASPRFLELFLSCS
jgi:hypothetical protein